MDYWRECISEALEDAGIAATDEQIDKVAVWVEGAHENYGMAHGHDAIPNPMLTEIERLEKELAKEKRKEVCPDCFGRRTITSHGPYHSASSTCSTCRGEGKI